MIFVLPSPTYIVPSIMHECSNFRLCLIELFAMGPYMYYLSGRRHGLIIIKGILSIDTLSSLQVPTGAGIATRSNNSYYLLTLIFTFARHLCYNDS